MAFPEKDKLLLNDQEYPRSSYYVLKKKERIQKSNECQAALNAVCIYLHHYFCVCPIEKVCRRIDVQIIPESILHSSADCFHIPTPKVNIYYNLA
jgi:hypothetical protein